MTRMLSRKAAAVGVAALVGVGGGVAGVAYAYPSGVPLTVSASASTANGQTVLTVSLGNADPRCATEITVNGNYFGTLTGGQTTLSAPIPNTSGRNRVRARTIDCDLKERARSEFVIPNAQLSGPGTAAVKDRVEYSLTGLEPGTTVTVTAVRSGGGATYSDTDVVDRRGEAEVRIRYKVSGTYAVSASVNGSVVGSSVTTVVS
ncbi:hypothetical protein Kisp01_42610 [Kineosporia sp. NBRC 101677]|uniref:hypothetical protein n=1 Tax=Kineosporia sp. NBRC 101677 TaxID=3032197 RepID=UPI0024A2AD91|nr:hypothetical protein [Kineosporia sp. NBRC 101677]GLY17246.1 hypothetical protein Kisp01_42610 [Kineosporia sp. NBRC 101677]